MQYKLFIDESGSHGLATIDPNFPVFVLCGVIFNEESYERCRKRVNELKRYLWGTKKVILHSRDIRKCEKEFQILFDLDKKKYFYDELNKIMSESDYKIISAVIDKKEYLKKYPTLGDVYAVSLSFIIERSIYYLDTLNISEIQLDITVEKRGRREDKELLQSYNELHSRGTYYVKPQRFIDYGLTLDFEAKTSNINGLQIADLVAYPIARYAIDKDRANPAFDVFSEKFYKKGSKRYGLKTFP
jgi:hypothetical protein